MKIQRRVLLLVAVFALIATSCGGTAGEPVCEGSDDAPRIGMAYDLGGRGDQSFNDLAAKAMDDNCAVLDFYAEELEPAAGGENREENLRLLAEEGFGMVIGVGFAYKDIVDKAAPEFPDAIFTIVDEYADQPNVVGLKFTEEEGSFLVGAAAALKSQTGKVGFIGGVATPLILKFQAGYEAGVEAVNPDAEVIVGYLTEAPDFTGFNDPGKGKEAALAMFQQGADIVYHAAGGSGGGLFEAAKETSEETGSKVWAIGVDSDQINIVSEDLKPYILTSMIKRVDLAVGDAIQQFVNGTLQGGQELIFDLEAGGVGYSATGGNVDDIASELDAWAQKIISGEIEVPTTPE